jgi:hypothetical protein
MYFSAEFFRPKTLALLCLLFSSAATFGQTTKTNQARNLIWAFGGGGISNLGGTVGAGLSHQFKSHLLSGRFLRNYDFNGGGGTKSWEIGGLYGRSYKTQYAMISGSGGVAYVGPSPKMGTVGLPLESQVFWTPTRYFGVGIYVFGNVNTKQSFGGAMLGIQLGRVTSPFSNQ